MTVQPDPSRSSEQVGPADLEHDPIVPEGVTPEMTYANVMTANLRLMKKRGRA